jgi:hypothetical protein
LLHKHFITKTFSKKISGEVKDIINFPFFFFISFINQPKPVLLPCKYEIYPNPIPTFATHPSTSLWVVPGRNVSEQNESDFGGWAASHRKKALSFCLHSSAASMTHKAPHLSGSLPPPSTNPSLLETLLVTAARTHAFLAGVCDVALLQLLLKLRAN